MKIYGLLASIILHVLGLIGFFVIEISTISAKASVSSLKVHLHTMIPQVSKTVPKKVAPSKPKTSQNNSGVDEVKPAKLMSDLDPTYPWLSRINKEEGLVKLSITLDKQGIPSSVKVIESSGFKRLDQSAIDAVLLAKYMNQAQKEVSIQLNLNFELKKKR